MNKDLPINKIIQGDCLKVIKDFKDNQFDLILTDPPYGINYESNYYKEENPFGKIEGDKKIDGEWIKEVYRVLKNDSCFFMFTREDVYPDWLKKIVNVGFEFKRMLVWVKNNWGMGDLQGNFASQKELIIFASKGRSILKGNRPTDILEFKRVPPNDLKHPTEKPVKLVEFLIDKTTDRNDLVLDPFLGSGTTAIACKKLGRNYMGIEKEEKYVEIAKKRLEHIQGRKEGLKNFC